MAGRIIAFFACLLCAVPFWLLTKFCVDDRTPLPFWSGDTSLKDRVKDIPAYNREMVALYQKYGGAFLASAVGFAVFPMAGLVLVILSSSVGIWLVYRGYKRILGKYT